MKVNIKKFDVEMAIRNSGVELEVRDRSGNRQLGDLVITKSKVIWCPGRTRPEHGRAVTWEKFIQMMDSASN